jgi:hypothetical protein
MALESFVGPCLFFDFVISFIQSVGLLELISPSQGHYLNTGQHKHKINVHTHIYALGRIRNHDPSVQESVDSSCLRLRGHCNLPLKYDKNTKEK